MVEGTTITKSKPKTSQGSGQQHCTWKPSIVLMSTLTAPSSPSACLNKSLSSFTCKQHKVRVVKQVLSLLTTHASPQPIVVNTRRPLCPPQACQRKRQQADELQHTYHLPVASFPPAAASATRAMINGFGRTAYLCLIRADDSHAGSAVLQLSHLAQHVLVQTQHKLSLSPEQNKCRQQLYKGQHQACHPQGLTPHSSLASAADSG